MRSWFERLTAGLVRRGVREGLLGGNGMWLAVGAVAWLVRFLMRRPARSVVVEQLALGESIVVTSVPPPPSGRRRRKLEATARKEARAETRQVRRERKRAGAAPVAEGADDSERKPAGQRRR